MAAGDDDQAPTPNTHLHVVFLPFYAPSHMIPLVDIARLFAARGVRATIITTPSNALLFHPSIHLSLSSGHPISVRTLPFPSSQVGLPEGIENLGAITSFDMTIKIFHAYILLQEPAQQLIRSLAPDCIFSDMFFPWTADLAAQLDIPRLLFYPFGFLYPSIVHNLTLYAPHDKVQSEVEPFQVHFDLPAAYCDKNTVIEMKRCQLPDYMKGKTHFGEMLDGITKSETRSFGLVHLTFDELEPAYAHYYRDVIKSGTKIWSIGPLSQHWLPRADDSPAPIRHFTLSWLDAREPNSVLYVCFGSMVRFPEAQLTEIALALEASDKYFIWVVRNKDCSTWLPQGFEERNCKEKGLIVREWVPQVEILGHPAVAGFMTHCGWNSILEAMTAGVPLITWPLWAEQFFNEKLVVDILGVAVPVGSEVWNSGFEIMGPVVGKEKIQEGIRRLMDESGEGERMRRAAKEVAGKAKRAVEEGGSSHSQLTAMIEDLKACAASKKEKKIAKP